MTKRDHIQALLNHIRRLGRPMNWNELDDYGSKYLNSPGVPDLLEATQVLLGQELVRGTDDGYSLAPTSRICEVEDGKSVKQSKLIKRLLARLERAGEKGILASILLNHVKVPRPAYDEAMHSLVGNGQVQRVTQSNSAIRYILVMPKAE